MRKVSLHPRVTRMPFSTHKLPPAQEEFRRQNHCGKYVPPAVPYVEILLILRQLESKLQMGTELRANSTGTGMLEAPMEGRTNG